MANTDKKKRYRDRANRNWRALNKEQERFGDIHDGGGKRYLVGIYFVLAQEWEKARAYFSWFDSRFPRDTGEPVFLLCWALASHEAGNEVEARYRFHQSMLSNLYLIPYLAGKPTERFDMWHSSNWEWPEYLIEVEEWLNDLPMTALAWLEAEYKTPLATQLRNEYIKTFHALKSAKVRSEREQILEQWDAYASHHLKNDS